MIKPVFLLIDDNKINLMILKQYIDKEQYSLIEMHGIQDAIQYCENNVPQIILSDIHLLDGTGWDLIDFIKNKEELKNTICIATSASTQALQNPQENLKNPNKGFDFYMPKPFKKEELWRKIEEEKTKRCL